MYFCKSISLYASFFVFAAAAPSPSPDRSSSLDVSPDPNLLPRGSGPSSQQVLPEHSLDSESGLPSSIFLPGSSVLVRTVWCKGFRKSECERQCYCPDPGFDMKCNKESWNARWKTAKAKEEIEERRAACGNVCLCAPSSFDISKNPSLYARGNKASAALKSIKNSSRASKLPPPPNPLSSPADTMPPPALPLPPKPDPWSSPGRPWPSLEDHSPQLDDSVPPPAGPLPQSHHWLAKVGRPDATPKGSSDTESSARVKQSSLPSRASKRASVGEGRLSLDVWMRPESRRRAFNHSPSRVSPISSLFARNIVSASLTLPGEFPPSASHQGYYIECRGRYRDGCEGTCNCTLAGNVICSDGLGKRMELAAGRKRCGEDCDCQREPPDPSRRSVGRKTKISSAPAKAFRPLQVSHRPHLVARGQAVSTLKKKLKTNYPSTASLPTLTCEGDKKKKCEMYCWCTKKMEIKCGKTPTLNLKWAHRTTKSLPPTSWFKTRECQGLCACNHVDHSDQELPPPLHHRVSSNPSEADISGNAGGSFDSDTEQFDPFATTPPAYLGERSVDSTDVSKAPQIRTRGMAFSCLKSSRSCSNSAPDPPPDLSENSWGGHPATSGDYASLQQPRASHRSHSPTSGNSVTLPQPRNSHGSHSQTAENPAVPRGGHPLTAANLHRLARGEQDLELSPPSTQPQRSAMQGIGPIDHQHLPDMLRHSLSPLKIGRPSSLGSLEREWHVEHPKIQARGLHLSCLKSARGCMPVSPDSTHLICMPGYQDTCDRYCQCVAGKVKCRERSSPCYDKCHCGRDPSSTGTEDSYGSHPGKSGNTATVVRPGPSRHGPSPLGRGSADTRPPSAAPSMPPSSIKSLMPFHPPYFSKRGMVQSCVKGSKTCDITPPASPLLAPPLVCQGTYHYICMMNCECLAVGEMSCRKKAAVEIKSLIQESHFPPKEARKRVENLVAGYTKICEGICHCKGNPGSFYGDSATLQQPSFSISSVSRDSSEIAALDYGQHPARGNLATLQRRWVLPGQTSPGEASPGQTSGVQTSPSQSSSDQKSPGQTSPGQTSSSQTTLAQKSPDQISPVPESSDPSTSKLPADISKALPLRKRGGGQSHLKSLGFSSSGGSLASLFTLQCNTRYQDSCDIHCYCDNAQNVECDKEAHQTEKGLGLNFSKSWIKKGVRAKVVETRARCRKMCECVNNSPSNSPRLKTMNRHLIAGLLIDQNRPMSNSAILKRSYLLERGGKSSCLSSPGGCPSDASSSSQTSAQGRIPTLRCHNSIRQRECDADCQCTSDRKVTCKKRFFESVRKLIPVPRLRPAYTGKHHEANVLHDNMVHKEEECARSCRCEDAPSETSPGPSTSPDRSSTGPPDSRLATFSTFALAPARLTERGGVASCLKTPQGCGSTTSSNSPTRIFKLTCDHPEPLWRDPDSCENHCDCSETGRLRCNKQTAEKIKQLTSGDWPMQLQHATKLISDLVVQKTRVCRRKCHCDDESSITVHRASFPSQPSSQPFGGFQKSSISVGDSSPYSGITPSDSPRLTERGGTLSYVKSPGGRPPKGPSTLPDSSPVEAPPNLPNSSPVAAILICVDSSVKSQFDLDCFCNRDGKIQCDNRAQYQINAISRSLHRMPLSKQYAEKVVQENVKQRTKACEKLCHCGSGSTEVSQQAGQSLVRRSPGPSGSKPSLSDSNESSSTSKPASIPSSSHFTPSSSDSKPPSSSESKLSSNSEPQPFNPKPRASDTIPIPKPV